VRNYDNTLKEAHSVGDSVYSSLVITQSDVSTGNVVIGMKMKKKTFDIVNGIIFNAGDDMNGSGILGYFYDETTDSPSLKMVYKAWTYVARELKRKEVVLAESLGQTTITHVDGDEYDYPADYNDYGVGKNLPNWFIADPSITTDSTFNDSLRAAAVAEATSKAKNLTAHKGHARWAGTINLQLRRFTPGKLVRVNSSFCGIRDVDLRINTVQYNLTSNSGTVSLNLEEDERKIGG